MDNIVLEKLLNHVSQNPDDPNNELKRQIITKAYNERHKLQKLTKRLQKMTTDNDDDESTANEEEETPEYEDDTDQSYTSDVLQRIEQLIDDEEISEEDENARSGSSNESSQIDLSLVFGPQPHNDGEEDDVEPEEDNVSANVNPGDSTSALEAVVNFMNLQLVLPLDASAAWNNPFLRLISMVHELNQRSMSTDQAIKLVNQLAEKFKNNNAYKTREQEQDVVDLFISTLEN